MIYRPNLYLYLSYFDNYLFKIIINFILSIPPPHPHLDKEIESLNSITRMQQEKNKNMIDTQRDIKSNYNMNNNDIGWEIVGNYIILKC